MYKIYSLKLYLILFLVNLVMAQPLDIDDFEFNQSTLQAFYFFEIGTLDDEDITMDDWIGAFHNGICVGARQWQGPYTDVPVMADDGSEWTDGYISMGDSPEFYLYDASNDIVLSANLFNADGSEIEAPPFAINAFNMISQIAAWTPDCAGVPGGDAEVDDCGICTGGITGVEPNIDMDCAGTCSPDTPTGIEQESEGLIYGAFLDECEACSGGESGHNPNSDDHGCGCFQPEPITYYFDVDGDGLGAGDPVEFCFEAVPVGWVGNNNDNDPFCITNDTDDCEVCGGNNLNMDCFGICFGDAVEDECEICGGDNSSCNAPYAFHQDLITDEDNALEILINAVDPNDDMLTYHFSMGPFHGTLSGDGPNMLYTPNPNYTGEDGFQYYVTDGEYHSNFAFIHIIVHPVNDPPVVQNIDLVITEDQMVPITLFATDPEGVEIVYSITNFPNHGTLEYLEIDDHEFMRVIYIPELNYAGDDSFSFLANDGNQNSEEGVVSIIITPINDVPVLQGGNISLDENTSAVVILTTYDPENNNLDLDIPISGPFHGELIQDDLSFTYIPEIGYSGFDQVTLRVVETDTEQNLFSIPKTFGFNVLNINDAPEIYGADYYMQEDDILDFQVVVYDADGGVIGIPSLTQLPENGVVSGGPSVFTYTPSTNYHGIENLIFSVTDPEGASSTGEILININPVNDAPVATAVSFDGVDPTIGFAFSLSGFVQDIENDLFEILWLPSEESGEGETFFGGSITHLGGLNFQYDHTNPGEVDYILYKARDEFSESALRLITFQIPEGTMMVGERSSMQTFDDEVTVMEYDPYQMTFVGLDTTNLFPEDGLGVNVDVLVEAENGDLSGEYSPEVSGAGSVISVGTGFIGSGIGVGRSMSCDYELDICVDTLVYQIFNPNSDENSDSTSIIVTVQGLNDAPVIGELTDRIIEEGSDLIIPITFSDPEQNSISVSADVITNSDMIQVILDNITDTSADLLVLPTINGENFNGESEINITVIEDENPDYSDLETFTITVTPINDIPVVTIGITELVIQEDGSEIIILDAFDADGTTTFTFAATVINNPELVTLDIDESSLTINAEPGISGTAEISVTANDGEDDSDPVTFIIQVEDQPDSPEFTSINYNDTVLEDDEDVVATFITADEDGDILALGKFSSDENIISLDNIIIDQLNSPAGEQRTVTITPEADANGEVVVYITMYDGSTAPVNHEFPIIVTAVNDAPIIADIGEVDLIEDQTRSINFQASDVENNSITYSITEGLNIQAVLDSTTITFTPNGNFEGSEDFILTASDGNDESNITVSVIVEAVNDIPVIISEAPTSGIEDEEYLYSVEISDPDSENFLYSLNDYPDGMQISEAGLISWIPLEGQVSTDIITLTVIDDAEEPLSSTQSFSITVIPINDPPEITSIPITEALKDEEYSYQIAANDPEGATLFYEIEGAPPGMVLSETQLITWLPNEEGITVGPISIIVRDGLTEEALLDTQSFTIQVASSTVIMEFELHDGANLISFYALPENTDIGFIMATLGDCVSGVIGEGVAASHLGGGTWVGSLSNISQTSGYWVKLEGDDCNLTVEGLAYDPTPLYELHDGANLISFPFENMVDISDAIPDDIEPSFSGIIGEGVAASHIGGGTWVGSLSFWEGKKGYWAKVTGSLSFNFQLSGFVRNQVTANNDAILSEKWNFSQSTRQAFYFIEDATIEGKGIEVGDIIISYCGETVVGYREWAGIYTDIPAMGDDGFENTNGYCIDGDIPKFKIFDLSTGQVLNVVSDEISEWQNNEIYFINTLTNEILLPETFTLEMPYPNPFNPVTNIKFGLPSNHNISLEIYDIKGRIIKELVNEEFSAGYHTVTWNAENISSGIYIIRMFAGHFTQTQKIILLK